VLTLEIKAKNDIAAERWENIQSRQCILATFNNWTISVRQNPYDFTFTEVDVIRNWCEERYKVKLSLLQIDEWMSLSEFPESINAVETFPPTITGIDAFIRSRAVASGRASGARPPIWDLCHPISCLAPWLLHRGATPFHIWLTGCCIQYSILKLWPPLLLNPGDGPDQVSRTSCRCYAQGRSYRCREGREFTTALGPKCGSTGPWKMTSLFTRITNSTSCRAAVTFMISFSMGAIR